MKVPNFLEWVNQRELEEAARHAYARDAMPPEDLQQMPERGDFVISNPTQLRTTNSLDSERLNKHVVSRFDSNGQPVISSLRRKRRNQTPSYFDVTPLFPELSGGKGLGKGRRGTKVFAQGGDRAKLDSWIKKIIDKEKVQDVGIAQFLGDRGNEVLNKKADEDLLYSKEKWNYKIQSWLENPVAYLSQTGQSIPSVVSELQIALRQMHEDPDTSMRIDQMRHLPYLHSSMIPKIDPNHESYKNASLEPESDPQQSDFDKLFNRQPQQPQQPQTIPTDPVALQARGQATGGHQPPEEPEAWRNLFSAWHNPWKYHKDRKVYAYFD